MGVRRVRDAEYWGAPVGTPIMPGMRARARGKMAKPTRLDPAGTLAQLRAVTTRQAARDMLASASKADLTVMLDAAGAAYRRGGTKAELRRTLVELVVGFRADSDAIMRAGRGR